MSLEVMLPESQGMITRSPSLAVMLAELQAIVNYGHAIEQILAI